jgi:hypothetical protein
MRFSATQGFGPTRKARRPGLRAAIRCALPVLLFAGGLILVVAGTPGLGWALLVFGLSLVPLPLTTGRQPESQRRPTRLSRP